MNIEETRNYLVQVRKSKNITQEELADRLNISQAALSSFENGKSVGWRALDNYAKMIGVELDINAIYPNRIK